MLKNHFKIMLRNLRKNKGYSFINIFGLAMGMACCILILLYVSEELSYENFHVNKDRLYKIHTYSSIGATTRHYSTTPPILATEMADSIPEIELAVRVFDNFNLMGRYQDNNIEIDEVYWADNTIFKMFTYEFLLGDPETALDNPDSLVITEETAARIFGEENPLGKVISIPGDREIQITGILKDVPKNSQFRFNGIMPSSFLRDREGRPARVLTADYFCEVYGYFLLHEGIDPAVVEQKMASLTEEKWGEMYSQRGTKRSYHLQSFGDVYLRSDYEYDIGIAGDINNVYLFSAIAVFVLLIACFNFINLSTARSVNRAREVGMRKVLGSKRSQLIKQFLSESIALSLVSLVLSFLIVISALPLFNSLSGKEFEVNELLNLPILLGVLGIIIVTGFISGSFPAFILSAFHPITVLKGKFSSASKNSSMRKILVVVQFSISVFMIVGIMTMVRQLDYMKNKDLGFNKDHLVVVNFFGGMRDETQAQRYEAMQAQILQNPRVVSLALSGNVPGRYMGRDAYMPEGSADRESVRAQNLWVGYDFVKTYEIEVVWGRDFSREFSTDANQAILLNEKALAAFGWSKEEAIGKRILNVPRDNRLGVVVGIIKDFHVTDMKLEIGPSILSLNNNFFGFVNIRIRPENVSETLAFLEKTFGEVSSSVRPDMPFTFDYYFMDDDFRRKYPAEDKVGELYLTFGILAIVIACLGLFGLASFTLEQRTKEIGVRKILGASVKSITLLLSKEFTKLVLISNLVAWPLAYYIMHRWLGNFAYRIGMSADLFVIAGITVFIIAIVTVSYHSVRASLSNPVDSLRYE